jgi:hypothetical protein
MWHRTMMNNTIKYTLIFLIKYYKLEIGQLLLQFYKRNKN